MLHRFQDTADYCQIFALAGVVPLFNAIVRGKPENSG